MIKKKRKLNKTKIRACIAIILIILILIIIMIISNNIKSRSKYKNLTILLNNELIETTNKVIVDENKNIYFSKDDIQKIFDNTIYFNEAEKELLTTYNTHVASLKIDEEDAIIDDENVKLTGTLKEIDKKVYLPITDLANVYDLEIQYVEKSNRIIMDSLLLEKIEAKIAKRAKVYEKKGLFNGEKLENLIIGDKIVVLEEDGKYTKIRTGLGNIGYIKTKKIKDKNVVRESIKEDKKELVVYDNYSNISGIYDNVTVDSSKLNVVVPTFFYIDSESSTLDRTTSSTATYAVYKNWADSNGLELMPTITNEESISTILLSYSQRSKAINSLKDLVLEHGYMGINICFDSIDDVNSFYRFVLELYPRFKASGIKVAITLNDKNLERNRLENVCDYIIEN